MTTYLDRSEWTTHPPKHPLIPMTPAQVRGVVLHWPGSSSPIGNPPASSIAARLEGYRQMHTSPGGLGVPGGGSDIAYQAAADQAGRVWTLRGVGARSGANGSVDTNTWYGALLLMLGPGDHPTAAMIQAVRDWRHDIWQRYYPHADVILGHRDVWGTECPGDVAYALIKDGTFAHPPTTHLFPLHRLLEIGARGPDVAELQRRVGVHVDGIFGPQTRDATQLWQRGHHITPDGIVGPITARSFGWLWVPAPVTR